MLADAVAPAGFEVATHRAEAMWGPRRNRAAAPPELDPNRPAVRVGDPVARDRRGRPAARDRRGRPALGTAEGGLPLGTAEGGLPLGPAEGGQRLGIAEHVVDQRQQSAKPLLRSLEHMFGRVDQAPDRHRFESGGAREPYDDQASSLVRTRPTTAEVNSVVPAWPPRSGVLMPAAIVSSVPS